MAFEQKNEQGALFKAKDASGNQPQYTGKCRVGGEDWRIAAWVKEGRNGKFFSLKFSRPGEGGGARGRADDQEPPF